MASRLRTFLILVSLIQLFFAVTFFLQWPFAIGLWPFEGTTPLTYIFVASIFAAAGASTLWTVLSGNVAALAGIGLDYVTIFAPLAIYGLLLGVRGAGGGVIAFAIACLFGALFGVALFRWSARMPFTDGRPVPALVRIAFLIFVVALLITGGRLLLQMPNTIPWAITPQISVIMGCIFLGAAVYFLYSLLRPGWANAAGQLAGFLAYDLVLIVPFLTRLPTVAPEHRLGLIIYIVVVVFSGLLAIYYLFINRQTRLRATAPPSQPSIRPTGV